MISNKSVIVVGSGIVGCAIARELAVRGVAVTVFDDRPVAGGATRASAGMLAPYVEAHERGPLRDLAVRSLELYDEWIAAVRRESDVDVEYRRIGTLEVALDPQHAAALQRQASDDDPDGVAGARRRPGRASAARLDRRRVADAVAWLRRRAAAGRRHWPAPPNATARRSAAPRSSASPPAASSVRVTTGEGDCEADTVVIAAGAWGSSIEGVRMPPLRPVRGQLLHLGWRG